MKVIATIHAHRLGDVDQVIILLSDIENAYNNIYAFQILTNTEFLRDVERSNKLSRYSESLNRYLRGRKGSIHRM